MIRFRQDKRFDVVIAAATAIALVALIYEGRNQWFFNDDWGHWTNNRSGASIGDAGDYFFAPHNGHWMTFNRVVYELIYRASGLRSYLLYLVPVFALHFAAAWLLRRIMTRAGVASLVASAAAAVFLVFGAGAEVLMWADAAGFMAGLVFGGLQLVLADHDEPRIVRRDVAGLSIGVLSMLTGAAALTMVGVVGVSALLRGRIRHGLFHVAPPIALWLAWYAAIGHTADQQLIGRGDLSAAPGYFYTGVTTSVEAVTTVGVSGVLTLALAWFVVWHWPQWRSRYRAPVLALAAGLPAFWLQVTISRISERVPPPAASRYLYLSAFFVLPLVGYAIDRLTAGRPAVRTVAVGVLAWAAISNLAALDSYGQFSAGRAWHIKLGVATAVSLPGIDELPADARLEDPEGIVKAGWVAPIGVLREFDRRGELPDLPAVTEHERLRWGVPLMVRPRTATPPPACTTPRGASLEYSSSEPTAVVARAGGVAAVVHLEVRSAADPSARGERRLNLAAGETATIAVGLRDVAVRVRAEPAVELCRAG